jgi:hypothetical protein
LYVRKDTKDMSEELKDILKKIEELREDINKMVVDNSLGDEEVIKKSRIMDMHLNRYQELINSKKDKLDENIFSDNLLSNDNFFSKNNKNYIDKKKLEKELVQHLESNVEDLLDKEFKKESIKKSKEKIYDEFGSDLEKEFELAYKGNDKKESANDFKENIDNIEQKKDIKK